MTWVYHVDVTAALTEISYFCFVFADVHKSIMSSFVRRYINL